MWPACLQQKKGFLQSTKNFSSQLSLSLFLVAAPGSSTCLRIKATHANYLLLADNNSKYLLCPFLPNNFEPPHLKIFEHLHHLLFTTNPKSNLSSPKPLNPSKQKNISPYSKQTLKNSTLLLEKPHSLSFTPSLIKSKEPSKGKHYKLCLSTYLKWSSLKELENFSH